MIVRRSRHILKKPRSAGRFSYLRNLMGPRLQRYKPGESVAIILRSDFNKTSLSHRHHGRVGVIKRILGDKYIVSLRKGNKELIARAIDLSRVQA